jgi:hypothetical protein
MALDDGLIAFGRLGTEATCDRRELGAALGFSVTPATAR